MLELASANRVGTYQFFGCASCCFLSNPIVPGRLPPCMYTGGDTYQCGWIVRMPGDMKMMLCIRAQT